MFYTVSIEKKLIFVIEYLPSGSKHVRAKNRQTYKLLYIGTLLFL